MKPRFAVALGLAAMLAGCTAAETPPASNPTSLAPPPPPALTTQQLASTPRSACPGDVQGATGTACPTEGEACGDPARSGFGIVCRSGMWEAGEMPHPPCCKK